MSLQICSLYEGALIMLFLKFYVLWTSEADLGLLQHPRWSDTPPLPKKKEMITEKKDMIHILLISWLQLISCLYVTDIHHVTTFVTIASKV